MRFFVRAVCAAAVLGLTAGGALAQSQPQPDPPKELLPAASDPFADSIFNPAVVQAAGNTPGNLQNALTANDPLAPLPSPGAQAAACACACPFGPDYTTWLTAEWLIGTTRGPSLVPIVTTGPASAGLFAGANGQPTTLPLFGGKPVLNDWRSGLRIEAGIWLDNEHRTGVSARIYSLFSAKEEYAAQSTGAPILNLPQSSVTGGVPVQTPLFVAFPGATSGSVIASTRTEFTGGDVNFRRLIDRGANYRVELLAGYRQLHLGDELSTSFDATSTAVPLLTVRDFGGDRISTTNNFFGPQLGLYASTVWNRFTLEGHAVSALGVTVSELDYFARSRTLTTSVQGNPLANPAVAGLLNPVTLIGLGVPPATAAAVLPAARGLITTALPAVANNQVNLTRTSINNNLTYLGVVGEGGLRVSYRATDHLRLTAGYSFIYWNNVRRAQEMYLGAPVLRDHAVDFTTHLFSVGLDVRY